MNMLVPADVRREKLAPRAELESIIADGDIVFIRDEVLRLDTTERPKGPSGGLYQRRFKTASDHQLC